MKVVVIGIERTILNGRGPLRNIQKRFWPNTEANATLGCYNVDLISTGRGRKRPMLELRQIRYFLAAAEHGSFRKGGLGLERYRNQRSAVAIRDLEDELGASLFQEAANGGAPASTLAGQQSSCVEHARIFSSDRAAALRMWPP